MAITPPKRSLADAAHAVVKAALSAIPVAGGPAVELFQFILQPPVEKRRDEWMTEVGARLAELSEKGLDLDSLPQNEAFVTTVLHATQIALRTHQSAKLAALKNAVSNVALRCAPDEELQHSFLMFVDALTATHLQILKLFATSGAAHDIRAGALMNVLEQRFPQFRGQRDFLNQLWRDLISRGLLGNVDLNAMMSEMGLSEKRTTALGDQFLQFIEAP